MSEHSPPTCRFVLYTVCPFYRVTAHQLSKIFLSHTKLAFAGNFIEFDFPLQFILPFCLSLPSLSLSLSSRRVSRYSKITSRCRISMRLNCRAERLLQMYKLYMIDLWYSCTGYVYLLP